MAHRIPGKIRQEIANARLHPVDIQIVAKSGFEGDVRNSRLLVVYLPWMKVKAIRLPRDFDVVFYQGPAQSVWV